MRQIVNIKKIIFLWLPILIFQLSQNWEVNFFVESNLVLQILYFNLGTNRNNWKLDSWIVGRRVRYNFEF